MWDGVEVILPCSPLSMRHAAMEVGEVEVKRQPHTVEAQRHAETA